MNFSELIAEIEKRPEMYIGQRSLRFLHVFLMGYQTGLMDASFENISSDIESFDYNKEFEKWLCRRFNVIGGSHSWCGIILFNSMNDIEALDNFFKLYKEYLEQQ